MSYYARIKKELKSKGLEVFDLRVDQAITAMDVIRDLDDNEAIEYILSGGSMQPLKDKDFVDEYVDCYGFEEVLKTITELSEPTEKILITGAKKYKIPEKIYE
jgi:hypothetical protein